MLQRSSSILLPLVRTALFRPVVIASSSPLLCLAPAIAPTTTTAATTTTRMASSSSASSSSASAVGQKPKILSSLPPIYSMLHEAKAKSGLSFEKLAQAMGRDEWYVAAIFYGQAKPAPEDLEKLSNTLDLRTEYLVDALGDGFFPHRGLGEFPPQDPVLYRLYEVLVVYGYPLKHMIHEKFGDGIMSAIDFEGHVDKIEDPKGDRVKITLNGKFLPYRRW